ncbi:MAG: hypothetical protein WA921_07770 [Ahrensia sp.]
MIAVMLSRAGFACTAFLMVQTGLALAGDTVLMRKSMEFHQCPQVVENILTSMNASGQNVVLVRDTGAHYSVKLRAVEANLVLSCNAVTEQIEITRQVPGDLAAGDETASAN